MGGKVALQSVGAAAETSISLPIRQQDEQAVAGWVLSFCILLALGTSDLLSSFNLPLQSPPVLGRAHPMTICDVSSQVITTIC